MKGKTGMYRKYLYTGWLCLLMFAASQMGHAALKIYYVRVGDAFWENTLWRMDINGENKELFLEHLFRCCVLLYSLQMGSTSCSRPRKPRN